MLSKLKYFLIILASSVFLLQLYILIVADSEIDNLARFFLVATIVGAFLFRFVYRRIIIQVPYMGIFVHSTSFLIVMLSFWIHAGFILMSNSDADLSAGWIGIILIMPAIWGIGLLIEAIVTLNSKGCRNINL